MENQYLTGLGKKDPIQQLQEKPGRDECLIVGIGASAGGIVALQEFFRYVPEASGLSYVVILHLSPDHDSQLAQVLQRETKIPVTQVTEKIQVKANHIYVVSPNQHLAMEDDCIAVFPNAMIEERRAPVDIFFRTLADEHGPRSIAVILSGTGANGSMGLKRVKERGGACFVQNPQEAQFKEMPQNAIATGMVDAVLPVADIPSKIISYKTSLQTVEIAVDAENAAVDQQNALREIFTHIKTRTGHDFSNYKRPTLLRRIERRINIHNLPDLSTYVKFLLDRPNETIALMKDLLISVTNFFRDKKAFEQVESDLLPAVFKGKSSQDQVRIWVAGCATGEEAYSIAMLCAETGLGAIDGPGVQIFATDIDESVITVAREGIYTINDTADISPERLRLFFNKEGDSYRVRREIREKVMFATHNFLKDPPFSHLDLVTCRNVMIYLNQSAQERAMETFHFALNPGSFLFLGTSESVGTTNDLYAVYNRENHIFQSRQVSLRTYPIPESTPSLHFDKFKKELSTQAQENKILERISFGDLHQQLLEEYAAPSLVINEEYDILHLTEKVGKYMHISGGELTQNLLKMIKPQLRLELRAALFQAMQLQSAVEVRNLKVNIADNIETVNIHIRPVLRSGDAAKGFILVMFEPGAQGNTEKIVLATDEPVSRQLEEELMRIKAQLRGANEQHDFQGEEMKAANEELQAMNEELRSAAEELETSKEELQSMNEELRTVNQELKVKIDETSVTSNNLQNLINSTDIGTIFLDRSFRVALFTPAARNIFNLIPADIGRPLTDITHKLDYDELLKDTEFILEKLITIEKEVSTKEKKSFLMRLTPYRTDEDRIKGVVITFLDITERKKTDEELVASEQKYRTLFDSIDEGFCLLEVILDGDGKPVDLLHLEANAAFEQQTGLNLAGKKLLDFLPDFERGWIEFYSNVALTGKPARMEYHVENTGTWFSTFASRVGGDGSRLVTAVFNNITERKHAEERQVYLLNLSDALRPHADPLKMQTVAADLLGKHLKVSHAYYGETRDDYVYINHIYSDKLDSLAGKINYQDFGQRLLAGYKSGDLQVSYNTRTDANISKIEREVLSASSIGAYVGVPLLQHGEWVALLVVHSIDPRRWKQYEIELIRDTAERTWTAVERAKAEEALKDSEEQLKGLLGIREEFIGIASHELKTPVTTLSILAERLEENLQGKNDQENSELIGKVNIQVKRLGKLINELLDTSKIEEGRIIYTFEKVNINTLIAERVDEMSAGFPKRKIILDLDESKSVHCDKDRIGQVINNLLSNAIKYSDPESEIIVKNQCVENEITISVIDQGIGIPNESLDKIFDRFYRGTGEAVKSYPGMGLGLYISSEIIKQHGGKISVKTEVGKGSEFSFSLPL